MSVSGIELEGELEPTRLVHVNATVGNVFFFAIPFISLGRKPHQGG